MPRTDTPTYSTYTTKQFPLVKEVFQRSTNSYDALYENCYIETLKSKDIQQFEIAASKRDGTTAYLSSNVAYRGMHYCPKHQMLYYCVGNTIYYWDPTNLTFNPQVVTTLPTISGRVGFTDFLYSSGTVAVVFTDGNTIGEISEFQVATTYSSPNLFPHYPDPVYLDGYLFLVKQGTQDIYNSDLDAPGTWNNEYITAEMSPDSATALAKISNYIVVFGTQSIEFFYDAQNAGGSPLSRNETVYKHVGYIGGKAQYGSKLFFLGKNLTGAIDVYMLEETKLTPIGNPQVVRTLGRITSPNAIATGCIVAFNGKTHYVFTYGDVTFAYNLDNDMFCTWKYGNTSKFTLAYTANVSTDYNGNISLFMVSEGSTGVLGKFVLNDYRDNGTAFTYKVRTDNLYNDTMQMKFISRMSLFCDAGNTNATIQLRWTDDDYQTYSNPVSIQLNQELASVRRLGGYRRRAFEFSNSENYPIRMWGYELDLNMGAS